MRELAQVHLGRATLDAVERERGDHFLACHLLAVLARRPAQQGEVVEQGERIETFFAESPT